MQKFVVSLAACLLLLAPTAAFAAASGIAKGVDPDASAPSGPIDAVPEAPASGSPDAGAARAGTASSEATANAEMVVKVRFGMVARA